MSQFKLSVYHSCKYFRVGLLTVDLIRNNSFIFFLCGQGKAQKSSL